MAPIKKRGLGMGLSALMAGDDVFEPVPGEGLRQIPIERLRVDPATFSASSRRAP